MTKVPANNAVGLKVPENMGKDLKQETVYGHLENGNPVLADDYCLSMALRVLVKKENII
ncbi:hypothetical protein KEH51_14650 [[Brevibacterium] frigoritolerans]|uniref:Uncharacterized protein n=1 Tax=Peribacillus frigoritolerans TaxID=450367 RepID=A0A941FP31_9BACI|nr:hypothetical protein [Peribacillus frigoritolerans]